MVNFSQEQTSGLSCAASPSTLPLSLLPGRSVSPCDEQCGVTLHPGFRVAVSHMADSKLLYRFMLGAPQIVISNCSGEKTFAST
jgi:hypothetical protein